MNAHALLGRALILCGSAAITACSSGGAQEPAPPPTSGGTSPAPTVALSASPSGITTGATSTLTWSSTNAISCTASGGWNGSRPTSGNETTSALTQTTSFTLTCIGNGGTGSQAIVVTVTAATPAPTINLTATPSSIIAGQSSTLNWTTTNATSCTASGGWSNSQPTAGSQSVSPASTTSYTLMCSGAGGSSSQSTQVTVNPAPPPPPTVTLTATPPSVTVNGTSTLTWTTTNATSCNASGGWSGPKTATGGTQQVGPLTASTDFTLTCTNASGSDADTVNVAVTGGGGGSSIVGSVDSVHIDLNGSNRVYVFAGSGVTPRDYRGTAGDPIASAVVNQNDNACTFGFDSGTLAPGAYTVAFTSQANLDTPTGQETLTFVGTTNVTVGATPTTRNFSAPTVRQVGPGKQFATIAAAASGIAAGTVIEVDAGTYTNDIVSWGPNRIVVRGVGGLAHVRGSGDIPNGKGLFVIGNAGMRIENMEFSNATVADENGAGIRYDGGSNLTICNSSFHDNENGILTGGQNGTLTIEYSTFANNGFGDGFTHNVYVGSGGTTDRLVFRHNYSHHARIGHTLKTRAKENYILYNRIMDEADGTSSYVIDVSNGGLTYVIGNLLQQGPLTDNSAIVAYAQEGLGAGRTNNFYLINNTIVNDDAGGTFVISNGGTPVLHSANNLFVGPGTTYGGKQPTTSTNNLSSNSPGLVDRAGFDYRLTSGSPARDAGAVVGTGDGFSLTPVYEYVHPARRQLRETTSPPPDIGAYEF